jgi:hypothetical protein
MVNMGVPAFLGFFGCLWFVEKEAEEVSLSAHACSENGQKWF